MTARLIWPFTWHLFKWRERTGVCHYLVTVPPSPGGIASREQTKVSRPQRGGLHCIISASSRSQLSIYSCSSWIMPRSVGCLTLIASLGDHVS